MKKLLSFESKRRPLFGNLFLSIIVAMVLALAPAWAFWKSAETERLATTRSEFAGYSSNRVEQLTEIIQTRVNSLNVLATTVPELGFLDFAQFKQMFEPLMLQLDVSSLCWHDFIQDDQFYLPEQGGDCDHFELFQSAILMADASPRILLTQPAGNRQTVRAGYISMILDLGSVSATVGSNHQGIEEFFYFDLPDKQSLKHYQYEDSALREVDLNNQFVFTDRVLSPVLSIPGLSIIYEAIDRNQPDSRPLLLGLAVWLASVLLLLGLAILRWQNVILDREVAVRTEELSQFGYRASHDLKSPLVSIKQLSFFVVDDIRAGDKDNAIADVTRIQKQATELEVLVNEILNLTRADVHMLTLSTLDFKGILDTIRARHDALIREHGTALSFNIGSNLPSSGQTVRVVQILDNLISNALKYVSPECEHPSVKVSVSAAEGALVIEVLDNGVGLGEAFFAANKVKMFQRFHPQLASGSGIGLAIVCKHVEQMRGTIEFEAMYPGSRVVVKMPIDKRRLSYDRV